MARINDLLRQLESKDSALADEISREVRALSERRAFGLNFERHTPEQAELPGRSVRRGDKVHILPPRGEFPRKENKRIWLVDSISQKKKVANLIAQNDPDHTREVAIEDLVVVAKFRDPTYPGLVSTGKVERGGDKPFHTVINGENFHALEALLFTHRGKVDAIYIDPPYNTGARDWKYNNDYVESDDIYRHSKWLAFMERRLFIAKELLKPTNSVLIVTIDEKEYLRLGLLLEQTFAGSKIQMISSVINPKGTGRANEFARVDEYIYFVSMGEASIQHWSSDMLSDRDLAKETDVRWRGLARTGRKGLRSNNPGSWYPIFINKQTDQIHSIGDTIRQGEREEDVVVPEGTVAIWPPANRSEQFSWSVVPDTLRELWAKGAVKTGKVNHARALYPIYYLSANLLEKIDSNHVQVLGRGEQNELLVAFREGLKSVSPKTVWSRTSHDAGAHGTNLVSALLPGRKFPFPKSLYAVEDALRFYLASKSEAVVLDFFAGSGTTAHAVMRLNKQDGGRRLSISVTNNEVGVNEQKILTEKGLRPGDSNWEEWGICEHITKPRLLAAVTGETPDGEAIKGDYKFTDEFPMADGFQENVEFFTLSHESPLQVAAGRVFGRIAPLLWMRAGPIGRRIDSVENGWEVADSYGVLTDLDKSGEFTEAISKSPSVTHAFVFTDEDRLFEVVVRQLPDDVEVVRMNDAYVRNAEIEAPAVAL